MVHGSVPRVPQSSGDHQSSSSMMQHIKAPPHRSARLQHLPILPNKVGMVKVGTQKGD